MTEAQAISPLPTAEIVRIRAADPLVTACNGAREAGQDFVRLDLRSDAALRQTLLRCLSAYRLAKADPAGLVQFAKTFQIEPPRKCKDAEALLVIRIAFGQDISRTFGQRQSRWAAAVIAADRSDPSRDPADLLKNPGVDWLSRNAERGWWPVAEVQPKPNTMGDAEPVNVRAIAEARIEPDKDENATQRAPNLRALPEWDDTAVDTKAPDAPALSNEPAIPDSTKAPDNDGPWPISDPEPEDGTTETERLNAFRRTRLGRRIWKHLKEQGIEGARLLSDIEEDLIWSQPTVLVAFGPVAVVAHPDDPQYHELIRSRLHLYENRESIGESNSRLM